jgi:hypothetical protein
VGWGDLIMQLPNMDNFILLLAFVIPGFVTFHALRLFSVPNARENKDFILSYVTLSALNFALAGLLIPVANSDAYSMVLRVTAWGAFVFVIPYVTGILLGAFIQKNFVAWMFQSPLLRWTGLKPINHIPTAWDWKFGQANESFVLVTLTNGTEFTGLLDSRSFVSSNPAERDMFIQMLYDRDIDGNWLETTKSLYVAKDQIKTVEFWPATNEAQDD